MSAVLPGDPDGVPTPALVVHARGQTHEWIAYALRHFDFAVEALDGTGPWTAKADLAAAAPLRWRHHGSDAHLHVSGMNGRGQVTVELYSRTTGRPAPIFVTMEDRYLPAEREPETVMRSIAALLRETNDALVDHDAADRTIRTWTLAIAGHLAARGVPAIGWIDLPDRDAPLRIVVADAKGSILVHPDLDAIARVVPRARIVESPAMDVEIGTVRSIVAEEVGDVDPMEMLRTSALIARAVERWNGGSS